MPKSARRSSSTRFGFTTVFDIASSFENTSVIRERVRSGEVTGPRILTVGGPLFPANGTPIYVRELLESNAFPSWEVGTASAAADRARRLLEAGADGVKIFAGAIVGGDIGVLPMPSDVAAAAVREAHRARKPAFAHPSNAAALDVSLESGVDVLAHTAAMMGPWSDELAARLVRQRVALIPTLFLFRIEARRAGEPPEVEARMLETATQQLRTLAEAGGEVLFGTDAGYIDVYDTAEEFRQMSRALDLRTLLASLTTNPSDRFGDSRRRGGVATGFEADLVVLDGDPALDVTALARVRYTIRAGKILYRADAR
jgi:imidazolonepropionase-like amidohydrolase